MSEPHDYDEVNEATHEHKRFLIWAVSASNTSCADTGGCHQPFVK